MQLIAALMIALFVTGCGGTGQQAPLRGGVVLGVGAAGAGASPFQTPVQQPLPLPPGGGTGGGGGPYNDEVHAATSADGLTFTPLPGPLFQHASVPTVVELTRGGERGTRLMYFVDFTNRPAQGREPLAMSSSRDGRTWSAARPVTLRNLPTAGAAVDPSVIELPDGRLRMYFFASQGTAGDPAKEPGPHAVISAISTDGVNFEVEGICFTDESLTDPDVLRVGDRWWMLYSKNDETWLATSDEGRTFRAEPRFRFSGGGIPGGAALPDGRVRVFAAAREGQGIVSAVVPADLSAPPVVDPGARVERGTNRAVADPCCIRLADGSYFLVYKAQK